MVTIRVVLLALCTAYDNTMTHIFFFHSFKFFCGIHLYLLWIDIFLCSDF
jgi:hypothetical protein